MTSLQRYPVPALAAFARDLLRSASMPPEKAAAVADTLLDGDLLGHDTHGLALLAPYLDQIAKGFMQVAGDPEVLKDREAVAVWDGHRLPGPWLMLEALEVLKPKARRYGTASLVVRNSHHIACLGSYLRKATEEGFMAFIASSDPTVRTVAPHGGTRAVFTPNPMAMGLPTSGHPVLVDISSSITTNSMVRRLGAAGQLFPEDCLLDAAGVPSRDPAVISTQPPGTLLPLGGVSAGHKGYGMALYVEALTSALGGYGRADPDLLEGGWCANVYLQLHDLEAYAGQGEYVRQMDWIVEACQTNPPQPGVEAVRLPGQRAAENVTNRMASGVPLRDEVARALQQCAGARQIPFPSAVER